MWVILPIKKFQDSKLRLHNCFSEKQREEFSYLLCYDTLKTLSTSSHVAGVTIVSNDGKVSKLASEFDMDFIRTIKDSGYNHDAMLAIDRLKGKIIDKLVIMPSDLPMLSHDDLELLNSMHKQPISLCEAEQDGGTNALIFSPPLAIPLLFGRDSFRKHQQAARDVGIEATIIKAKGLQRDIDNEDDISWLLKQQQGGLSWKYVCKHLS